MPLYNNTKKKQFSKFVEADNYKIKDKKFKALFVELWEAWQDRNSKYISNAMDKDTSDIPDLAHFKGKASHPELRYNIGNVQLISREAHSREHSTGKQIDYRPEDFKDWIKSINYADDKL